MGLVLLLTIIGVMVGICLRRAVFGPPPVREALAMIMSLLAVVIALPVGAVIILCGVVDVSGAYGRWLILPGLAVTGAALAVLGPCTKPAVASSTNVVTGWSGRFVVAKVERV